MAKNFYLLGDAEFLEGSGTFSALIGAAPLAYHLEATQATAYADQHASYADAYQIAREPATRTRPAILNKDAQKAATVAMAKDLCGIIRSYPDITDAQLVTLGMLPRPVRHTRPPLTVSPAADLLSVVGRVVAVNIHDSGSSSKRGKASGAVAAWVYSFIGETYPSDPALWRFEGAATRGRFEVTFDGSVPGGTQVWICAAWVSARGVAGPPSVPITTTVQGGAAGPVTALKMAA